VYHSDQGPAHAAAPDVIRDEEVVHQHCVCGCGGAVEPVQGGEAHQLVLEPGTEEEALVAGLDEPAEELPVPVVVRLGLVEPLVPGDQGQRGVQFRALEGTHLSSHAA
jgi:hypothetical protein